MLVRARGMTFEVTDGGPADGAVVLLLHGFPQHRGMWTPVAQRLHAAGLRTYALDQRGYSPGVRPRRIADYRMSECVADLVAVLDELAVPQAHVAGHDWGALAAWHLAARHPDRVRTLTAVSVPHPLAIAAALADPDSDQRERSAYVGLFRERDGKAERLLLDDGGRRLRALFAGCPPELIDGYVTPMLEPAALTSALNWYRAMTTAEIDGLGAVTVPTTFVWGDQDLAIGERAALGCAEHVTGEYRLVRLAGVSHWVPDEAPEQVAAAVLDRVGAA
jgi:pimeloyl-ACP methyl ester carboxylesterase